MTLTIDLSKNEFQHSQPVDFSGMNLFEGRDVRRYPRRDELQAALARHHELDERSVVVHPGGAAALAQLFLSHSWSNGGSGDVLLPDAGWQYYGELAERTRMRVLPYPMVKADGAYRFDVPRILELMRARPGSMIVLTSPNNPTGASLGQDELHQICASADGSATLLLDQCYEGFGAPPSSIRRLVTEHANVVALRTFSKFYGLAGARIAYTVAGAEVTRRFALVPPYLGFSCIGEQLAIAALENRPKYLALARKTIEERQRSLEFFNSLPGCECYRSDANFLLMHLPGQAAAFAQALNQEGILVRTFAASPLLEHVRVTIGTSEQMSHLRDASARFFRNRARG